MPPHPRLHRGRSRNVAVACAALAVLSVLLAAPALVLHSLDDPHPPHPGHLDEPHQGESLSLAGRHTAAPHSVYAGLQPLTLGAINGTSLPTLTAASIAPPVGTEAPAPPTPHPMAAPSPLVEGNLSGLPLLAAARRRGLIPLEAPGLEAAVDAETAAAAAVRVEDDTGVLSVTVAHHPSTHEAQHVATDQGSVVQTLPIGGPLPQHPGRCGGRVRAVLLATTGFPVAGLASLRRAALQPGASPFLAALSSVVVVSPHDLPRRNASFAADVAATLGVPLRRVPTRAFESPWDHVLAAATAAIPADATLAALLGGGGAPRCHEHVIVLGPGALRISRATLDGMTRHLTPPAGPPPPVVGCTVLAAGDTVSALRALTKAREPFGAGVPGRSGAADWVVSHGLYPVAATADHHRAGPTDEGVLLADYLAGVSGRHGALRADPAERNLSKPPREARMAAGAVYAAAPSPYCFAAPLHALVRYWPRDSADRNHTSSSREGGEDEAGEGGQHKPKFYLATFPDTAPAEGEAPQQDTEHDLTRLAPKDGGSVGADAPDISDAMLQALDAHVLPAVHGDFLAFALKASYVASHTPAVVKGTAAPLRACPGCHVPVVKAGAVFLMPHWSHRGPEPPHSGVHASRLFAAVVAPQLRAEGGDASAALGVPPAAQLLRSSLRWLLGVAHRRLDPPPPPPASTAAASAGSSGAGKGAQPVLVWDTFCEPCSGFSNEVMHFAVPLEGRLPIALRNTPQCFCPGSPRGFTEALQRMALPQPFEARINAMASGAPRDWRNARDQGGPEAGPEAGPEGGKMEGVEDVIGTLRGLEQFPKSPAVLRRSREGTRPAQLGVRPSSPSSPPPPQQQQGVGGPEEAAPHPTSDRGRALVTVPPPPKAPARPAGPVGPSGAREVFIWVAHKDPGSFPRTSSWLSRDFGGLQRLPDVVVGRAMYEFSHPPPEWAPAYARVAELWVPSAFVADIFAAAGVARSRLHVLPEPIDVTFYDPDAQPTLRLPVRHGRWRHGTTHPATYTPMLVDEDTGATFVPPRVALLRRRFKFLSVFKWEPRKGWDVLLAAYFDAFLHLDPICTPLTPGESPTISAASPNSTGSVFVCPPHTAAVREARRALDGGRPGVSLYLVTYFFNTDGDKRDPRLVLPDVWNAAHDVCAAKLEHALQRHHLRPRDLPVDQSDVDLGDPAAERHLLTRWCEAYTSSLRGREPPGPHGRTDADGRLEQDLLGAALPHVEVVTERLTEADLVALYNSVDAFVLPTRGEGWGLPIIQAMAMALPTIATNWSGCVDFLGPPEWNVDSDQRRVSYPISVDGFSEVDGTYGVVEGRRWADPSRPHLRALLEHVVAHPAEARAVGRRARQYIAEHFAGDVVAGLVVERSAELARRFIADHG